MNHAEFLEELKDYINNRINIRIEIMGEGYSDIFIRELNLMLNKINKFQEEQKAKDENK